MNIMVAHRVLEVCQSQEVRRSRIHAAVVGGFSYIILNNILDLLIDFDIWIWNYTDCQCCFFSGSCLCCKCKLSFADVAAITEI